MRSRSASTQDERWRSAMTVGRLRDAGGLPVACGSVPLTTRPVPPEAVLDHIPDGADLIVPLANGEPAVLLDTIEANHQRLSGVRVHQMHALRDRPSIRGEL